jgi:hypothetical protein
VQVDAWNAKVDRREAAGGVTRPVVKPIRKRTAPLLPAWRLASSMQWVLCWENLEVVGPTASWVRETLQNSYSTDCPRKQSAGLFRPCSLANVVFDALVGQSFLLDGENWEVVEADASTRLVKYTRATTERTGDVGPAFREPPHHHHTHTCPERGGAAGPPADNAQRHAAKANRTPPRARIGGRSPDTKPGAVGCELLVERLCVLETFWT